MKKIIFLLSFLALVALSPGLWSQNAKKIKVKSKVKGCWAALITEEEAKDPKNEYGWWSVWHRIKKEKKYKLTPAVFKNVPKGKYIIVIYNPASKEFNPNAGIPEQSSDGVVLEEIDIQESETYQVEQADFKEWNCLSCPWLYIWNGQEYVRQSEVIKDIVGKKNEQSTYTTLSPTCIINKKLRIRIQEEKDEVSYLNRIVLRVGQRVFSPTKQSLLAKDDQDYLQLKKGDKIDLEFDIDIDLNASETIILETQGYYEPNQSFLDDVYQKYLKTKR